MRAEEVVTAVLRHYGCLTDERAMPPEWAALEEFSLTPGGGDRRADLFLVRAWGGKPKGHERHAVEVKVSRRDLLAELANAGKRKRHAAVVHRFWFATPEGLVQLGELPEGCGLYEVTDRGVRVAVQAPRLQPREVDELMFVEAFRRASRAETRTRRPVEGDLEAEVVALRAEVATARRGAETARNQAAEARERARELVGVLAHTIDDLYCSNCGERLKATARTRRGGRVRWAHVDAELDGRCTWPGPDLVSFAFRHLPVELIDEDEARETARAQRLELAAHEEARWARQREAAEGDTTPEDETTMGEALVREVFEL